MPRYGFNVDFVVTAKDPKVAQKLLEGLLKGPGSHFEPEVIWTRSLETYSETAIVLAQMNTKKTQKRSKNGNGNT
jgi:hypothetical protein